MTDYTIEFNVEEVEKLKRCAQLLNASAGQNEEYQGLATWLSGICNEEEDNGEPEATEEGAAPKPKKAKIRKRK